MIKQVGGTHYGLEDDLQHWDWVTACGIGYLDGVASKYIVRWREKDGIKDVKKAISYVEKLIDVQKKFPLYNLHPQGDRTADMYRLTRELCHLYDLSRTEEEIMYAFLEWKSPRNLHNILELTRRLLPIEDIPLDVLALMVAKPVPLEDSNKYADRAESQMEVNWKEEKLRRPDFCSTADDVCHHPACSCAPVED